MSKSKKGQAQPPAAIRSRIVGEGMEAPDQLLANPQNWRRHPKEQLQALEGMLDAVGWVQRVIVNRTTGHLVDGHARVELALKRDEPQVPVLYVELSADEERVVLAALDPIGGLASTDQAMLDELLNGVESGNDALDWMLASLRTDQTPEKKPEAALPEIVETPPVSRRGDVWLLGEHRLMCGSCTDEEAVAHLLRGEQADLCLTDPPYGLGDRKASGKNDYIEYVDSRENLVQLAREWLPIARKVSRVVVFSPGVTNQWLYPEPAWVMCWFYGGGQLRSSWGFNCWQPFLFYGAESWGVSAWEPFLAYGKDPSLAAGMGGRPDAVNLNTPANAADIDHPCPKPVALWDWMIGRLVFKPKATFYEPFSGSGTTLIAAEPFGHKVRAMELTAKYVDVAVQRWQNFTGQKATLEGDGRTFAEVEAERLRVEA